MGALSTRHATKGTKESTCLIPKQLKCSYISVFTPCLIRLSMHAAMYDEPNQRNKTTTNQIGISPPQNPSPRRARADLFCGDFSAPFCAARPGLPFCSIRYSTTTTPATTSATTRRRCSRTVELPAADARWQQRRSQDGRWSSWVVTARQRCCWPLIWFYSI